LLTKLILSLKINVICADIIIHILEYFNPLGQI
jgi:hypothetical protein